jgi:glycosyltransferase involved in cell wall biosynthesis
MKILYITDFLRPQTHGIAIRCEEYIKNLREKNHSVKVYGPSNCPTTDVSLPSIVNLGNKDNRICLPSFGLFYDLFMNKYDIIHLFYPPSIPGFFILLLSLILPLKIVTSNHVNMNYYGKAYNIYYLFYLVKYFIYAPQFFLSSLILSPSELEDFKILYDYKTDIIPTGVNIDLFNYNDNNRENILLYVGRLAPEKNIDKLILLFENVKNYKLQIIGFGPYEKTLKELAKGNNNIEFLGKKLPEELPAYYQKARAHITLSESETFCLTLLESISCGTPIIYPDCELFNGLYENDFSELCLNKNNDLNNILNFIENNENELRERCKKYRENLSWSTATDKLIEQYKIIKN